MCLLSMYKIYLKSTFQDSISQNNTQNCQYFEELELNNKLKSLETNQFSFLTLNIQSLPVNLKNLKLFYRQPLTNLSHQSLHYKKYGINLRT